MHLLATLPGVIADGSAAVDLAQTPGDIVVLSSADTELALLAAAAARRRAQDPTAPSLRLAPILRLGHNFSVDLYMETIARARLVIARVLGGSAYWPYGVERLVETCRANRIPLALLPGDDKPDPELADLSTLMPDSTLRLWRYLAEGGPANAENLLRYAASLIGHPAAWAEPAPLLRAGLYWPDCALPSLDDIASDWRGTGGVVPIVFYRALVQSGNTAPVDALVRALSARRLRPLPIFVQSLKDGEAAALLGAVFSAYPPAVILNATGFSVRAGAGDDPLAAADCPVLQVVFSGGDEESWRAGSRGLHPRDLAMNVALPEIDGRILSRAVSFKAPLGRDPETEIDLVGYRPVADRVAFVADLARNWARLRERPRAERRVALILANYPNRDGRIGNGVGLDTPASALAILRALAEAGYRVGGNSRRFRGADPAPDRRSDQREPDRGVRGDILVRRIFVVLRDLAAACAAGDHRSVGSGRTRPVFPRRTARLRPVRDPRLPRRQCRGADPAGSRLWHRSEIDLSRPGIGTAACLSRRLCLAGAGFPRRCRDPSRQARHPRMAAGEGAGIVGRMLPRGGAAAIAASLSVHRQRSRRGNPGQAARPGGDRRPSDPAADPRRQLWPDGRARAPDRRVLRGCPRRFAASRGAGGGDPRTGAVGRARRRLRHHRRRGHGDGVAQARRPAVRDQGIADPRRASRLRPEPRGSAARRIAGRLRPPRPRRRPRGRLAAARLGRRSRTRRGPARSRHGRTMAWPASGGAHRSRAVAQCRRHGRTPGGAGAASRCGRGSAPRMAGIALAPC